MRHNRYPNLAEAKEINFRSYISEVRLSRPALLNYQACPRYNFIRRIAFYIDACLKIPPNPSISPFYDHLPRISAVVADFEFTSLIIFVQFNYIRDVLFCA